MSLKLIAPPNFGVNVVTGKSGLVYPVAADGTITVTNLGDTGPLLTVGFALFGTTTRKISISSPLPADLVSVVAAVTPSNVALTIAAQPPQARKLQIRVVIGTTTTTAITAGNLALIGLDQDGNAVTENISLIQNASATLKSANAYSQLISATVSAYAASGSGTGNTVGIGPSNDFGVPTRIGVVDFALIKASKITKVLGTSNVVADDVASTATVDTVARTIAPTTVPAGNGLVDYEFTYAHS